MSEVSASHPINVSTPQPSNGGFEATMNKTNSPLTSEIIGESAHHHRSRWNPHPHPLRKVFILVICLSSFIKIGIKPHQLMLGQAPVITSPHIHYLKNIWQKYIYWNSVKPVTDVQQPSKSPTWIKSQGSTLKMSSGIQNMPKSLFGQLCKFLMSCDTHHQTCVRYLPKECSSQVTKRIEK